MSVYEKNNFENDNVESHALAILVDNQVGALARYLLFKIKILTGSLYCFTVDNSCKFIKKEASPATHITNDFGKAICTPIAAGNP